MRPPVAGCTSKEGGGRTQALLLVVRSVPVVLLLHFHTPLIEGGGLSFVGGWRGQPRSLDSRRVRALRPTGGDGRVLLHLLHLLHLLMQLQHRRLHLLQRCGGVGG